jgi:hypothetical protein
MNRRDALKKLGEGSAVVVGATAVKSLPAFAFFNPVIVDHLDVTVTGNLTPTATISIGSAMCSGSAIAPCGTCDPTVAEITAMSMTAWLISVTTPGTRYGWGSNAGSATSLEILTAGANPDGTTVAANIPTPYVDPFDGGFNTFAMPFRHLNASGGSLVSPEIGDTIQISGYVQYACSYGDGTGSVADTIDYYFTKISGGWQRTILT